MTDIKVLHADDSIIRRQDMFFGTLGATANRIASDIASDALVLGCTSVKVWSQDGWWLIAGNLDWLNAPNRAGFSGLSAFECPWALPEAGQNFHLSAVMARIFATATATRSGDNVALVKGEPADLEQFSGIGLDSPYLTRVIGFRFQAAA